MHDEPNMEKVLLLYNPKQERLLMLNI